MARVHGRRGVVYIGLADNIVAASPLPFIATWSMNFQTKKEDVTAMEDSNAVYVAGLPDASGQFSGFFDDASAQTYTAATDGLPRKFYLYPNRTSATTYWFGTVLPDFAVNGGVSSSLQISASWNAASSIIKVG